MRKTPLLGWGDNWLFQKKIKFFFDHLANGLLDYKKTKTLKDYGSTVKAGGVGLNFLRLNSVLCACSFAYKNPYAFKNLILSYEGPCPTLARPHQIFFSLTEDHFFFRVLVFL